MQIISSFINGAAYPSDAGTIDKIYPATGEVIAKVEKATSAMLDEAVRHASEAQKQ